ncbi:MAG TPA: hypothetical protein DCZ95_08765 [Verrucomicrobia bacterium]|nr:hypothetical protein [Verrucomicrobiota bacterium]
MRIDADKKRKKQTLSTITTKDGTQIYYKDWGTGQPVVFSHGWPLSADSWEAQMMFLASNGYRCIAHGRSSQPWSGNEMDTYADDLSELLEKLDLKGAVLIGFSAGGGRAGLMEWSSTMGGKTDIAKGRIKEAAGALVNNDKLRRNGKTDQAVGRVKQAAEKVTDKVAKRMRA